MAIQRTTSQKVRPRGSVKEVADRKLVIEKKKVTQREKDFKFFSLFFFTLLIISLIIIIQKL
jgi:hypothetical protein